MHPPTLLPPLSSSSFSNLLRLTAAHGCAPAFYPRFAGLALASLLEP